MAKQYAKTAQLQPATSKDVREAAMELRQICPLPLPVEVRACLNPEDGTWGMCSIAGTGLGRRFLIKLTRGMPLGFMHHILVHEWAHCLDWRPDAPFRKDHSATFGVHWAEVYCEFFGTT